MDRETIKVRMVYDAAAKFRGFSLNDAISPGPNILKELFDVLMRFKLNRIAVMCDISEMYLQIELYGAEDKPMHSFLWRDLDVSIEPTVYEHQRVVFGINASPFIALTVAKQNARMNQVKFPLAADTVLNSTYMDDSLDSVKDERTGVELYKQLVKLWNQARMVPRKWISNSKRVLECIPIEQRAKSVDMALNKLPTTKTKGLNWNTEVDKFHFEVPEKLTVESLTKRNVLSKLSSVFYPIGFVSLVIILAKVLMQRIWETGMTWDEPIEGELGLKIPRMDFKLTVSEPD
ncbi:uncharacterized protein [Antedon mediterranea]|uniref:uncharacterized protein n=1 Tax=Antedon mediterranea TaxID=105859 RepID=UPI003AF66D43